VPCAIHPRLCGQLLPMALRFVDSSTSSFTTRTVLVFTTATDRLTNHALLRRHRFEAALRRSYRSQSRAFLPRVRRNKPHVPSIITQLRADEVASSLFQELLLTLNAFPLRDAGSYAGDAGVRAVPGSSICHVSTGALMGNPHSAHKFSSLDRQFSHYLYPSSTWSTSVTRLQAHISWPFPWQLAVSSQYVN
jgi:hypothetical protein